MVKSKGPLLVWFTLVPQNGNRVEYWYHTDPDDTGRVDDWYGEGDGPVGGGTRPTRRRDRQTAGE